MQRSVEAIVFPKNGLRPDGYLSDDGCETAISESGVMRPSRRITPVKSRSGQSSGPCLSTPSIEQSEIARGIKANCAACGLFRRVGGTTHPRAALAIAEVMHAEAY
jgi:hypothetical protein